MKAVSPPADADRPSGPPRASATPSGLLRHVERELSLALVALGNAAVMFDDGAEVIDPSCGAAEQLAALHADVAAHNAGEGS